MISLDNCSGTCNVIDYLSIKIRLLSSTKYRNVNVFNMIRKRNEAKKLVKSISCNCKSKFDNTTCNLNQKWINDKCQCECNKCRKCKKDYGGNPSTCICESGQYLKSLKLLILQ